MPQTTNYNLPTPAAGDLFNVPADMTALAAAVDVELTRIDDAIEDSGQLATLGVTMATGWSLTEKLHRIIGKTCHLRLAFSRTGAALEGSTNSNVADTDILTITTTSLRPQWTMGFHIRFSNCGGGGELNATTGVMKLTDLPNGGDVGVGETGQVTICYPLP